MSEDGIVCQVVDMAENEDGECVVRAECVAGHEIPRMAFPVAPLKALELTAGARFAWKTSTDEVVLLETAQEVEAREMAEDAARLAELNRLRAAFDERMASGEVWEEYTGDGT